LIIPRTAVAPIPTPAIAKKPTAIPAKPQLASAPETQLDEDEYFEEVVVHHYATHQSAKARTDADGVKRISDTE
jgi:hypothetical protein